jgi:asparaginyl-tRNA synthetase
MLEAECAFLDADVPTALEQVMAVAEDTVRSVAAHIRSTSDFERYFAKQTPGLNERVEALLKPERWVRMDYKEALELLQKHASEKPDAFVFPPTWEGGLQTEHERWLAEEYINGPLFVINYPTEQKPFYMLPNPPSSSSASSNTSSPSPSPSSDARPTTACFDLLVPALGELAGGSLREHRPSALLEAMKTHNLDAEAYEWYVDLRRYGTTRHGGFGMGWERLVGLLTGQENVRECVAFPRAAEGSRF